MATVFDVLLDTARALDGLLEGTATADGTATTLIDTDLLTTANGFKDNDFNGGTLFWKTDAASNTQVTDEAVATLAGETSFSGYLDFKPIVNGTVSITTPVGTLTDFALPDVDSMVTMPPITAYVSSEARSGSLLGGVLWQFNVAHGRIVPGTLKIRDNANAIIAQDVEDVYPAGHWVDENGAALDLAANNSIDYITLAAALGGADAAGLFAAADHLSYDYTLAEGSLFLSTGQLLLTFSTPQTGPITATYRFTPTLFLPLIFSVTDFAVSSGRVTFSPAAAYFTGSGDTYGLMANRYPRYLLFQKLNEALLELKTYVLTQTDIPVSSLVQNEYPLANNVRIHAIWNGNTAQAAQDWTRITRYHHANGRLMFYDFQFGDTLRIETYGDATPVTSETTALPATLDPMWLALETAVKCVRWRLFQPGADEKLLTMQANDLMARRDRQRAKANVINPNPTAFKTMIIPER